MIKITCVNPQCLGKSFLWDERDALKSPRDLVPPGTPGAVRLLVSCTYCNAENVIWVRKSGVRDLTILRGGKHEEE